MRRAKAHMQHALTIEQKINNLWYRNIKITDKGKSTLAIVFSDGAPIECGRQLCILLLTDSLPAIGAGLFAVLAGNFAALELGIAFRSTLPSASCMRNSWLEKGFASLSVLTARR